MINERGEHLISVGLDEKYLITLRFLISDFRLWCLCKSEHDLLWRIV